MFDIQRKTKFQSFPESVFIPANINIVGLIEQLSVMCHYLFKLFAAAWLKIHVLQTT
jgi:hypothetical protein